MNKLLMAMAFSAVLVALSASAQPYIGGLVGTTTSDVRHTSSKVFIDWPIIPNLEFEAAYTDFGGYRGARASADSLALVGSVPLGDKWYLFWRGGATENHTNHTGAASRFDILSGFGIAYNTSPKVSVRLETESYGKLPTDVDGTAASVTSWGVSAKFPF